MGCLLGCNEGCTVLELVCERRARVCTKVTCLVFEGDNVTMLL